MWDSWDGLFHIFHKNTRRITIYIILLRCCMTEVLKSAYVCILSYKIKKIKLKKHHCWYFSKTTSFLSVIITSYNNLQVDKKAQLSLNIIAFLYNKSQVLLFIHPNDYLGSKYCWQYYHDRSIDYRCIKY